VRCPTTQMPKGGLESHCLESQIPPKTPSSSLRIAQSVSTPYVAAICRGHMPLLETALPRCLIARRCEWVAKCICMCVFRAHSQRFVFALGTQFNGSSDNRRSASHFFNSGCALLRVRHGNGAQDKRFRYRHPKVDPHPTERVFFDAQTCEHNMSIAAIAQLGERQTEDMKVAGSIPGLGMILRRWRCLIASKSWFAERCDLGARNTQHSECGGNKNVQALFCFV
jgi:hypothetical protein